MRRASASIRLTAEEKSQLEKCSRKGTGELRLVERSGIILLLNAGNTGEQIAGLLHTRTARVSKWRQRFAAHRLPGPLDDQRSGKPASYSDADEKRVLALLDEPAPTGYSGWNGKRLAEKLGDVSPDHVWRILRKHNICLQRRRSWCISTDPEFASKAADVVGLYLHPPQNALVLAVDEKPSIQALSRAQGYLRLPNGQAVNGFSHCYQRHGTTTLFAALDIVTGQIKTGHYNRRRRREFLDFMNEIVAAHAAREIHVVLDHLNTHKPKEDRWLKAHANVHFHFIPTYSSWLNQIECWFSILSRQALRGASFNSPQHLREAIDRFVKAYNEKAAPFEWKKTTVFPSAPKSKYSYLCK